jgi:heme O synthase-like polyprenyltransferase
MGVLNTPPKWGWAAVSAMLAIDAVFLVLVTFFSRQTGWSALHILGLAAGGALDYGIRAFTAKPLIDGLLGMRISNTVFLATALWLIWLCARRVLRYQALA